MSEQGQWTQLLPGVILRYERNTVTITQREHNHPQPFLPYSGLVVIQMRMSSNRIVGYLVVDARPVH